MSRLVTYFNNGSIELNHAVNQPYTDINLAFLLPNADNPLDLELAGAIAASPSTLTQTTKQAISALQASGKKVLLSFGGGTVSSETYHQLAGNETELAQNIACFITENQLNGVDIDFEDTGAFTGSAGYNGVDFLVNLTRALRATLPAANSLITHAPQPPYLECGNPMGGYVQVMAEAGEDIDWLNVQFYNNPPWSSNPQEIVSSYKKYAQLPGLNAEKLLIGLPVTEHDAGSGYMPVDEIISDVIQPVQANGALGGMMNWQFSSDKGGAWTEQIGAAIGL
ncbi:glycosyl hydrolase family 18 protein [Thalassomonas sp. RHCl1]|uniref:glycosyl hydrolase family 18 protein n=1 Tax=Thalassomonas sp. RHCl1 TaxID=2995320 RepID=UPI00248CC06C|nr:glycosyl hydrolase family 18 protein [Thalassomonas sp. RHCl1]